MFLLVFLDTVATFWSFATMVHTAPNKHLSWLGESKGSELAMIFKDLLPALRLFAAQP